MQVQLDSVLIGRILAGVIILLALVYAVVGAATARSGGFEIFLGRLVTHLGTAFLIIILTEILAHLGKAEKERSESPE